MVCYCIPGPTAYRPLACEACSSGAWSLESRSGPVKVTIAVRLLVLSPDHLLVAVGRSFGLLLRLVVLCHHRGVLHAIPLRKAGGYTLGWAGRGCAGLWQ